MKKLLITLLLIFTLSASHSQIDGNLLLGLTSATTSEMNAITAPIVGSLLFNSDEEKIFMYTSSGFMKIPSLDAGTINFWSAIGNSGTDASLNFLGTTDAQDLLFKSNNTEALRILQTNQNIGIGTNAPSEKLDVNGSLRIRDITSTSSDLDVLVTSNTGLIQKRAFADFTNSGSSVSSDTGNSLSTGSDSGIFYESPIKAHGKIRGIDGVILNASGIATVVRNNIGEYSITLSNTLATSDYSIQLTLLQPSNSNRLESIVVLSQTSSSFQVQISDMSNANGVGGNKLPVDLDWYFTVLN